MSRTRRLTAVLVSVLLAAALSAPARADDDDKAAEAALARGNAQPMHELLERVRASFPGSVLKVELEHEDDEDEVPWVYEVKLLTPRGDVLELAYDAATLELIGLEGRHRDDDDDD